MKLRLERIALAALAVTAGAGLQIMQGHEALAQTAKDLKCKGCVSTKDMAKNAVSTRKLKNNAVSTGKLRNGAVSDAKIQDGAVTDGKLATGAVGTAKLQDGAVTEGKLAAGAVSSANLKDGAVTGVKLAPGLIGTTYSLLDNNSDLVATLTDPGVSNGVSFLVEFPGFLPQSITVLLNDLNDNDPTNDFYEVGRVGGTVARFTTNNCTGTVYVDPNDARSKTYFDYRQIGLVRGAAGAGQARPLYAPLNTTVLSLTIESTQTNNATCNNIAGSVQDVIEMGLVDPDLHVTFPPPYRIVPN